MRIPPIATVVLAIGWLASILSAQDDTALHREEYQKINVAQDSMVKVSATQKGDEAEVRLTGWVEQGEIRKILVQEAGGASTEYYLTGGNPLFVFRSYRDKAGKKQEERLYFKDGEVFQWRTTEKDASVLHAEDYQATTELHRKQCADFVASLKKDKLATHTVDGVFIGVEQGDYTHWQIKTKDGAGRSFFVLKADAVMGKVLENPKPYHGKSCRITWKKSVEEIPEAGGKMEIEQVVTVEWVK